MEQKSNKKKAFPKLKTKIKDFVSDESGSITDKGAITLGAAGMVALGMDEVAAAPGSCTVNPGHFNGTVNGHYNGTGTFGASVNTNLGACLGDGNYAAVTSCQPVSCAPISGIVNGAYSVTPSCSTAPATTVQCTTHANHNNFQGDGDGGGDDSCG
ncbi:hypothetical protein MK079_04290 [Candidatus Gracilibacteria bacterium]|nr:hypothetical protein [Candidatus Gracilibacteria bacterium]